MRHLMLPYARVAVICFVVTAMLLSGATILAEQNGSKDLPDAPTASQQTSSNQRKENAIELLNRRSKFFPDIARTLGPLDSAEKFKLFIGNSVSGHVLLGSTVSAGFGQAIDSNPGYRQGAEGYAKRFGSSMARNATNNFFGTFLLPSLLHQDPRYFVLADASSTEKIKYALRRTLVTRNDEGDDAFNWSGLLGPLASESIANSYLPSAERTTGRTFRRYGIDVGFVMGGNLLREYYPTISSKLGLAKLTGPLVTTHAPPSSPTSPAVAAIPGTGKRSDAHPVFGGTYDRLRPEQRRLVDDWFVRYKKRIQKNIAPEDGYNAVPISIRTTFEAVTHALQTTPLTDKQGARLGNALDLVDVLETARGKVPHARGDLQFRIYVVLKPNALATLKFSREFARGADNTVFHHSYPINYRQAGGDPSIQISVSEDGRRADIDVDYRASGFPAALFNGHLSAENSDVRAGNNYDGHLQRWAGLNNWWRNLFGLPLTHDSGFAPDPEQDIARFPRLTDKAPLAAAVTDFLSTWLVDRKPNLALAYVSAKSYACVTSELAASAGSSGNKQDGGNPVPRKLWNDMEETNFLIGQVATLDDAVAAVAVSKPALLPMAQKSTANFTLTKVPDDIAADLACSPEPTSAPPARKYGTNYASVFRLRIPGSTDAPILLLWKKESGHWQIISRQIDPAEVRDGPVPDTPAIEAQEAAVARGPVAEDPHADQDMVQSVQSFFDVLLIKRDFDSAFSYFAPTAYQCVNLALEPGVKTAGNLQDEGEYLRHDLKDITKRAPTSQRLEQIIESYDPDDPTLKLVHHDHDRAYMLTSISNAEVSAFECGVGSGSRVAVRNPEYATFFQFIEPGDNPAGLGLLWSKRMETGRSLPSAWMNPKRSTGPSLPRRQSTRS